MRSTQELTNPQPHVVIYTHASCNPSQCAGGYGALIVFAEGGHTKDLKALSGFENRTSCNQLELRGPISALVYLRQNGCAHPVTVRSSSDYLVGGINHWMKTWSENGLRKTNGKPVMNVELWQDLLQAAHGFSITWEKIAKDTRDAHRRHVVQLAKAACASDVAA